MYNSVGHHWCDCFIRVLCNYHLEDILHYRQFLQYTSVSKTPADALQRYIEGNIVKMGYYLHENSSQADFFYILKCINPEDHVKILGKRACLNPEMSVTVNKIVYNNHSNYFVCNTV